MLGSLQRQPRVLTAVLVWMVAIMTSSSTTSLVDAQGRDGNFIDYIAYFDPTCPEGCRDLDKYLSCGSVVGCLSCTLYENGNITLACSDGSVSHNTPAGCGTGLNPAAWEAYLNEHFELRTIYKFMYVFGKLYSTVDKIGSDPPYLAVSIIELIIVVYVIIAAVKLEKITRIICGAVTGELIAMLLLAGFNVTLNTYAKGVPMWVIPLFIGFVAAVWRRIIAFLCGFGLGFMVGVIMSFEVYARAGKPIDKNIFWVVLCLTCFFTVIAQAMKKPVYVLFVTTFAALCGTAGIIQLAGTYVIANDCTSMTVAVSSCSNFGAEGLFGFFWVVCFIAQWLWVRYFVKKKERQLALEESQGLTTNASNISMAPSSPNNTMYGSI